MKKKKIKFHCWGKVEGSKYLGTVEASTHKEAMQKAQSLCSVSLCHMCSSECENPEVDVSDAAPVPGEMPVEDPGSCAACSFQKYHGCRVWHCTITGETTKGNPDDTVESLVNFHCPWYPRGSQ